jgi:hypothetical protein
VSNARFLLIFLICTTPAVLLLDGPIVHGLVAGVAAVGLVVLARTMRPGETEFFLTFARPAAALLVIPALWILIQVLPIRALAHPIWASAETAIGHPLTGAISIDIGESVMALGQYLTIVAIGFWAAAVAVDRQRAEWILFALMGATGLIGLTMLANTLFGLASFNASDGLFERAQAIDCVAMGAVIAGAAGIRTLERYETRHANPGRSVSVLFWAFAACIAAFIVCVGTLMLAARDATIIAAAYGIIALVAVVCIRRFGLGAWGTLAITLPVIGIALFLVANNPELRTKHLTLAFATPASPSLISTSQRIIEDAPVNGTGAGTFAAIAPVYRDFDDKAALTIPPTAMAAAVVELGRPMFLLIVAAMAGAIYFLLRASLRRGRDSFYPTAGAGSLITMALLSLINAGALGTAAAMITAATLGLAIAQSKSRTALQ